MAREAVDPAEVRGAFLKLLDLSAADRDAFLEQLPPQIRNEVEALLASEQGAETMLRGIVSGAGIHQAVSGEKFGVFRITALVGRGGMGAVYQAERDDGEISQTVAIKVIERGWLDPRALERFRQERQILAGLMHPNIARLIDGGTREDGVPYLVMEYVDGLPLDQYCDQLQLKLADRLRLFLPLCEAVDSAHQKLIIHRDLKPSNVLVTAAGEPKLLDFGIAKALDATSGGETQTIVLTPDFASPEQARGEQATTAADIYGLGGVLSFLLTGQPPNKARGSLQPHLQGDLKNILLKALHEEPNRRYRSAREFAEDIERFLEQRPVRATPDSLAYRAGRFVRRHTWACAAAAIAAIAIAGGTGFSLYEAHRAEQRFTEVRTLANRFVFDFEASIRDTPGTLEARRMVASTAREYLAKLAADAGRDPNLDRELAESYYRLSRVEISAGESAAAIEHLRKSIELHKAVHADCCGAPADRERYIRALCDLSRYLYDARGREESLKLSSQALDAARTWSSASPGEPAAESALILALSGSGAISTAAGQAAEARKNLEEAVERSARLYARDPRNDDLGFERATAGYRLATLLNSVGETEAALEQERSAKNVLDGLLERQPENIRRRNLRIYMLDYIGDFERVLARKDPSLRESIFETYREAYRLGRINAEQNPGDKDALAAAEFSSTRLASHLIREERLAEALPVLRQSLDAVAKLVRADPSNRRNRYLFANDAHLEGNSLTHARRWTEAAAALDHAEKYVVAALAQWPDDLELLRVRANILIDQSATQRNLGRPEAARGRCLEAMKLTSTLIARTKDFKRPVGDLEALRTEAKLLGVPDLTAVSH